MEDKKVVIDVPIMATVLPLSIVLSFGYVMFFGGPTWVIIVPAAMPVGLVALDTLLGKLRELSTEVSTAR